MDAPAPTPLPGAPFNSSFMAGFEGSSHRRRDGRQLDIVAQSRHDDYSATDYALVASHGLRTVRDALRWHRIETAPGQYDWSSAVPMLRAALATGVQVIWDLSHYGLPHDIDVWSADFVERFARFAGAWARVVKDETDEVAIYCPINEMSFWAWGGAEHGYLFPCTKGRGAEFKRQLARAAIAGIDAVRSVDPRTRIIQSEPLINVLPRRGKRDAEVAEIERLAQFEATDMVAGQMAPELGGSPDYLDLLGLNYYHDNQFTRPYTTIPFGSRMYRPLPDLLAEVHARYGRPMFLSETGVEGANGPGWLRYVAGELRQARASGLPVLGLCLYPVMDYPGWDNARHCRCGLIEVDPSWHTRSVDVAMAQCLRDEQALWDRDAMVLASNAAAMVTAENEVKGWDSAEAI